MEERALVTSLRAGEGAAFDAVYDRYRPRIFGFLVRLCGRRDLAEDLLQETFLRLASKAHTLAPDTRLSAWLFTVARNLHVSHCRRLVVDFDRMERFTLFAKSGPAAPTPFEALAEDESVRRLERMIAALPPKYREVILLVGVEGMSHEEAAKVLNLKPPALRKRLSRARGMMKVELTDDGA